MNKNDELAARIAFLESQHLATTEALIELKLELASTRSEAAQQLQENVSLLESLQLLTEAPDSADMFAHMSIIMRRLFDFEHVFVLALTYKNTLVTTASSNPAFKDLTWQPGAYFRRVLAGDVLAAFDVAHIPEWKSHSFTENIISALHVPIHVVDHDYILVITHSERGFFTRQHAQLAERFSPIAAQALRNAELLTALRDERDQLEERVILRTNELQSERDFALQIMGAMGQGLTVIDHNGTYTYVNPAFANIMGISPEKLIGQKPTQLYDSLDCPEIPSPVASSFETTLSNPYGVHRHVLVNMVPRVRDGVVDGNICVITDLTDREDAEAHLRERELEARKLSQVASRTDNLVIIADSYGYIEWVNDAFVRVTGFTLEEVKGQRPGAMLQGPDTDPETIAYMSAQLRAKQGFTAEVVNYSKTGRRYWVALEVQPVYDDHGTVINFIAIESDITERKKYEHVLRESEERLRKVIDGALDAVIAIDAAGIILEWNPQAERIFGWSREEVVGKRLSETIIPHVHRSAHENGMDHYHATGEGPVLDKRIEIEALHHEGHHFPIELAISPVRFGDELMFSAFLRDITERKQTEEVLVSAKEAAEAADRAKSEFLANMSHEIRTPMNAVIGLSGLLLDTKLTAEQNDYVSTIRQSGDALLTIINDILDFSKIEAGRLELETSPFNLRQCVEEALDLFAAQAGEKRIDLAYFIEPGTPEFVVGDVTRLRQILVNLVGNAIKFTPSGEVVVTANSKALSDNNVQLTIAVRDTGIGIAPDQKSQLFKAFSQVDASMTRKFGGTGLGLVITKRLVKMMNGDIRVDSSPDEGTKFIFDIIVQYHAEKTTSTSRDLTRLADLHVLTVDDNATNHTILSHYLTSWGMVIHQAETGYQALQLVEKLKRIDVAILDVHMPEMDGLTLAQILQQIEKTREVPIIILSSSGRAELTPDNIVVTSYLNKPLKPGQLYNALVDAVAIGSRADLISKSTGPRYDAGMAEKHPLQILVAEDNAVNQKVAIRMLEKLGYRADLAANGLEVLEALERRYYDLILMDIQMPELDGVAAMQAIRADKKAVAQPYIVALTAHALQGDRERYLALGMDDYVSKPVHMKELVAAIERCQPTNITAPSPIDHSILEEQFGEDAAMMLAELLPILLEDAAAHVDALEIALAEEDSERLQQSAHAIKGAAATIGALELAEAARALEAVGRSGVLTDAAENIKKLLLAWERIESYAG